MKPTLFVLAAGMGSRYGGLKQLDELGPNGETIMDYSIYDALRAGFGKVVFVIRHSFEDDFRKFVVSKFNGKVPVEIVFQEIDSLPEGFTPNPERVKPWGTNHAIMMGASVINEPFGVVNADDFYGRHSFQVLCDFLKGEHKRPGDYCMVAYHVGNTLSESGTVSRGVCSSNEQGQLTSVVERTQIEMKNGQVVYRDEQGLDQALDENALVSMNMWGFTPDYFEFSKARFVEFLKQNSKELKAEFYIPTMVNELISSGRATVKVLSTTSKWFGVTYASDREQVVLKINELVRKGEYPAKLWE
ncbi:MAG: nucleotidyltransferase [Bacteroidales bacterium]|nr:nucleotidyltransferase [Bacteroidales bacterium]MBR6310223.1 nucleotidyltransferase [Paludibacteraceae bacterium]MDD6356757.1 nucleotidyltransferase [Bacteroidales bacterium]